MLKNLLPIPMDFFEFMNKVYMVCNGIYMDRIPDINSLSFMHVWAQGRSNKRKSNIYFHAPVDEIRISVSILNSISNLPVHVYKMFSGIQLKFLRYIQEV